MTAPITGERALPICERLREKGNLGPRADGKVAYCRVLTNPDGPEAADTIEALYEALERVSAHFANLAETMWGLDAGEAELQDCADAALAKARGYQ